MKNIFLIYCYSDEKGKQYFVQVDSLEASYSKLIPFSFKNPKVFKKAKIVGSMFKAEEAEEGFIRFNANSSPIGKWKIESDLVYWRAKHESYLGESRIRKDLGQNDLKERLLPISEAYREGNYLQRQSLLAHILRIITSH